MIDINTLKEIYLFSGATDARLGITGLTYKIKCEFGNINLNQQLFVFCSKKKLLRRYILKKIQPHFIRRSYQVINLFILILKVYTKFQKKTLWF